MTEIKYQIIKPDDNEYIGLIAEWYFNEWIIPIDRTIQRLQSVTADKSQFQVLMTQEGIPISTGGLYNHVGLLDREPRLKIHKNWLALVYTTPDKRHQGYGASICKYIQDHSKKIGLETMYLFTDSAERLYKRLGWTEMETLVMGQRNILIMKKDL